MYKISHTDLFKIIHPERKNQINTWVNRGVIPVDDLHPGRGKIRMYTWPEAVMIAAMVALLPNGRNHKLNAEISKIIADRASEKTLERWHRDDSLEDEYEFATLIYQILHGKLFRYKFIEAKDFSPELIMTGFDSLFFTTSEVSFIDCDYIIHRFAEQIVLMEKEK